MKYQLRFALNGTIEIKTIEIEGCLEEAYAMVKTVVDSNEALSGFTMREYFSFEEVREVVTLKQLKEMR